jgi:hypothetical protein
MSHDFSPFFFYFSSKNLSQSGKFDVAIKYVDKAHMARTIMTITKYIAQPQPE